MFLFKASRCLLCLFFFLCCAQLTWAEAALQKNLFGVEVLGSSLICPQVVLDALKVAKGHATQKKHRVRKNINILKNWLKSQGYMDVTVQCLSVTKNQYKVHEGQRWKIASLSIKPAIDKVYPAIPKVGHFFTTEYYEQGKKALQALWVERGYLRATFAQAKVKPNVSTKSMHIQWEMAIGTQYRIADIAVEGNETYHLDDIIRLSALQAGGFATMRNLTDAAQRISRDIRFQSATVLARVDKIQQDQVPVLITVVETPRFELLSKLGYSSDLGLSVQAGFKDFGLLKGRLNALLQTEVSDVQKGAGLMISRPSWPSAGDATGVQADFLKQDSAALRTSTWSAGVFLRREWSQYNYAKLSLNEKWLQSSDVALKLIEPALDFRLDWRSYQSGKLRDGWRIDGRFALPVALQGQGKWISAQVGSRFYIPLQQYFLLVPRAGYAISFAIKGAVPKQLRQYLGGAENVRGYKLDSVGFSGSDGLAAGGRKAAYAGIDIVAFPQADVSPVVFADMGRVWDVSPREQPLAVSAGLGVILHTDIGAIRVDMALPLRRFGLNMGSRWYFSLGEVL